MLCGRGFAAEAVAAGTSRQRRLRLNLPLSRCGGGFAAGFRCGGLAVGVSLWSFAAGVSRQRGQCSSPPHAWNNAVRTRGVFTHRADFLKPACVERGLVRTGPSWGTQLGRLELGHRSRAPEPGQPGLVRPIWCARQVNPDGRGWWTAKELQRPCVADNGNMESTSNCVRFRTRHIWLFEDRYSCFIILANSIL